MIQWSLLLWSFNVHCHQCQIRANGSAFVAHFVTLNMSPYLQLFFYYYYSYYCPSTKKKSQCCVQYLHWKSYSYIRHHKKRLLATSCFDIYKKWKTAVSITPDGWYNAHVVQHNCYDIKLLTLLATSIMGLENILTCVTEWMIQIFWNMMQSWLTDSYRHFTETWGLYDEDWKHFSET